MRGQPVRYLWNGPDTPPLLAREIAELEGLDTAAVRRWFKEARGDVEAVKAKAKDYKARVGAGGVKVKLYPYPDEHPPRLLPIATIQKYHDDLSIPLLRQRYRMSDPCDWDEIFRPKGKSGYGKGHRLLEKELKGLGPRGDLSKIPGPSELEKRLWG